MSKLRYHSVAQDICNGCILYYMNKRLILLMATIGGGIGSYVPVLFGDNELLDGWSIFGGMIGGFIGIWLGVWLSKRY